LSLIKVSSSRGDYVLLNLRQVAWATVDTEESGAAHRITLHMMDGVAFQLRGAEADYALKGLHGALGEPPGNPALPE
jgi:hypothetical protein